MTGVYAAVLAEGMVPKRDSVNCSLATSPTFLLVCYA